MAELKKPLWTWRLADLTYFRRRSTLARLQLVLSAVLGAAAVGWIFALRLVSGPEIFSSGPASPAHAVFARDCAACHGEAWQGLARAAGRGAVTDRAMNTACLRCHAVMIDHDPALASATHERTHRAAAAAACSECHMEHEGATDLAAVADARCVSCHADLERLAPTARAPTDTSAPARRIPDFAGHPEIRALGDAGTIKFNHAKHFDRNEVKKELACQDCHRAGESAQPWRYGEPAPHEGGDRAATSSEPDRTEALMSPIRYSLHCSSCHDLDVGGLDLTLSGAVTLTASSVTVTSAAAVTRVAIAHETPEIVRERILGQLLESLATADPGAAGRALGDRKSGQPKGPQKPKAAPAAPRPVPEQLLRALAQVEGKLYGKADLGCLKCHALSAAWGPPPADAPTLAPPGVPARWLTRSSFSHGRHKAAACDACHHGVEKSKATADLLLPRLDDCHRCHGRSSSAEATTGGASDRCTLCHTYHRAPEDRVGR